MLPLLNYPPVPESPSFVSRQVRWSGLVDAGLFIGLAASWLGLLGSWHWLLDLFSHFRWQGTVVSLLALAWAAWRKRRGVMGAALLTLLLNAALWVRPGWSARSGNPAADFHVKVISFNVLTSNGNQAGVLTWLQRSDADIIFLMEVDHVWAKALQPLLTTHPHHLIQPRSDNFGLALYSRLLPEKISSLDSEALHLEGTPEADLCMDSIEVRLETSGREWIFIGTHPVPPMGGAYAAARDRQLQALSQHVAQTRPGLPVLLAGDLNATPWSHGFREITAGGMLHPAPGAWQPTWRVGSLFAIPIDHALAGAPLLFKSRDIGPDLGSDHRPQVLELGWAE